MTKTTELAERYAQANYNEWVGDNQWQDESDYEDIKDTYRNGAQDMLERVLDFMRTFQDGSGNYPLYDYMYLAERIRCVERVMANEFPDEVSYQEMIECLWEDLKLAQKQIQYTYGKVLN